MSFLVALPGRGRGVSRAELAVVPAWSRDDAAHLLRRAGFGGTPEQIDRLHALGGEGAVDYLITGELPAGAEAVFEHTKLDDFTITPPPPPDPALLQKAREILGGQRLRPPPGPAQAPADGKPAAAENPKMQEAREALKQAQQQAQRAAQQDLQAMRAWWVDRMVRTDRPLDEKMTLFWHGLFTSGVREVKNPTSMEHQNALFHREALGNYKQLAHDIVHDAAMLKYLNNDENVRGKPNENLARELMELFTMGEGKGYTETDIKEVARALTGLAPLGNRRYGDGPVGMRERLHDPGQKTIFGKTGDFGPDDVVDLIFARPEPARHLARKLWEFYAYPEPSDGDLEPIVRALEQHKFDVKPALRALFNSPGFYGERARFALIKSPVELAVEAMRQLGAESNEQVGRALVQRMGQMDQQLMQPPNVRGWVGGDNWITASTLYARYNTAGSIVNGTLAFGGPRMNFNGKPPKAGGNAAARMEQQGNLRTAREEMLAARGGAPGGVRVAKLFPKLGAEPTGEQLVDAAIARFLQRPLHPDKRAALVEALGDAPIHLGQGESDARVRQMLCLLLSTPEYQVH